MRLSPGGGLDGKNNNVTNRRVTPALGAGTAAGEATGEEPVACVPPAAMACMLTYLYAALGRQGGRGCLVDLATDICTVSSRK